MPHKPAKSKPAASPRVPPRRAALRRAVKPRPRMKMPDAMRAIGLDELKLAGALNGIVDRLSKPTHEKSLLDCVKECGKFLEAYPKDRQPVGQDPVQIVLDVPRPPRDAAASVPYTSAFDPGATNASPLDPDAT